MSCIVLGDTLVLVSCLVAGDIVISSILLLFLNSTIYTYRVRR
jgi:hypothetical protein